MILAPTAAVVVVVVAEEYGRLRRRLQGREVVLLALFWDSMDVGEVVLVRRGRPLASLWTGSRLDEGGRSAQKEQ